MAKTHKVSSWSNFLSDFRANNKDTNLKGTDVMVAAGEAWRKLIQAQKDKFAAKKAAIVPKVKK